LAGPPPEFAVADTADLRRAWERTRAFYAKRHDRLAWSRRHEPNPEARELIDLLRNGDTGLDPHDYGLTSLERLWSMALHGDSLTPASRQELVARLDVRASLAYLRMAPHLFRGRIPASVLDPDWNRRPAEPDWPQYLDHALDEHEVIASLRALEPRHLGYRRLRDALARYRLIAAGGGWPTLPPGPPLKVGDEGQRVALLVRRLIVTGDLRGPHASVFDRGLERAVGDFQARHGIPRSGVAGEATREALNVPVASRIETMALNLERWRWLPDSLPQPYVMVNIPAYRLDFVRANRVQRTFRVVVGRKRSPTPVFSDQIAYLELNPTWTLPRSVLVKEIVPALKHHPDYLARNHMHVISIATTSRDTIDPATVPWEKADTDSFLYLVIQDAGPENPLGRLKMMCPNEYDVYLHDTPTRDKFGVAVRDFSHGCVRVAQAEELADSLLGAMPGDTMTIEAQLLDPRWRRLRLPRWTPVHFLYWTAWVDSGGPVQFRDDLYGIDARVDSALTIGPPDSLKLNRGVELSPFWVAAEAAAARDAAARAARAAAPKPRPRPAPGPAPPIAGPGSPPAVVRHRRPLGRRVRR